MAHLRTIEKIDNVEYIVDWHNTGEIVHEVDCHNYDQIAKGYDQNGKLWIGTAEICTGTILKIHDPEMF